ncbi:MAG: gephyrin-like molybdotransferase Glp [Solirubrobacterales bacterium]
MSAAPISVERARAAVLAGLGALEPEQVPLAAALGRRLGADAVAPAPVQAFDNSAMDGFALRAADAACAAPGAPARLRLVGEACAGHPAPVAVGGGEAVAISTGAMLPEGADAVARVEDTRREGEQVLVEAAARPGLNVRRAGEDFAAGETVLGAGTAIGAAELGVLASLSLDPVPCVRRPRVAVVTSGDELTPLGEPLAPGAIRDSNGLAVPALAALAGAEVVSVGWAPDEPEATEAALATALGSDLAVVCGGVSVGEHDHVKPALARLGVEQVFWRVALRPGGPTWFGRLGPALVFGLPGNPVSALVTFLLFARPALLVLGGGDPAARRTRAVLAAPYAKPPGRAHAARCRLELGAEGWLAHPFPRQGSHVLTSMVGADCLALIPAESGDLEAGAEVEVELLDGAGAAGPLAAGASLGG